MVPRLRWIAAPLAAVAFALPVPVPQDDSSAERPALSGDPASICPALVGTLENAEATLGSANSLIASDSPLAGDLKRAMRELAQAAHSLRLLAEQLEEQPESLLRGKE